MNTLEENGYWKSDASGYWYEKVYKNSDRILFNWIRIDDKEKIQLLEDGIIPELQPCGYDFA